MDTPPNMLSAPAREPQPPTNTPKPVQGVGGWLLFFIVTSVIVVVREAIDIKEVAETDWEDFMKVGMTINLCLLSGLICFYLYAVVSLAAVRKNAVRLIKRALIAYPIGCMVAPFTGLILIRATSGVDVLSWETIVLVYSNQEVLPPIIGVVVRSIIWYAYFSVSVRVKNTWPEVQRLRPEAVFS